MGFKTKKPRDVYNQAVARNSDYYRIYADWIIGVALNRFKWDNLPETCDERSLELMLLYHGYATIARPNESSDLWLTMGAVFDGRFDIYGNPVKWRTWSRWNNDWDFEVTPFNGVFGWDSSSRRSPWNAINKFAEELTRIKKAREVNRIVQNTPFAVNCPPESRKEAENMLASILEGQPAVGCMKTRDGEILTDVNTINVNVPYQPDAFDTDQKNAMGEALNFLGIEYLPRKQERVIEEEVSANSEGVVKKRLDYLNARKRMADEFNALTDNRYNVKVRWNMGVDVDILQTRQEDGGEGNGSGGTDELR